MKYITHLVELVSFKKIENPHTWKPYVVLYKLDTGTQYDSDGLRSLIIKIMCLYNRDSLIISVFCKHNFK